MQTPPHRGLDESHFRKLHLRRSVLMAGLRASLHSRRHGTAAERDGTTAIRDGTDAEPMRVSPPRDYDYNNENDADYCVNGAAVSFADLRVYLDYIVASCSTN